MKRAALALITLALLVAILARARYEPGQGVGPAIERFEQVAPGLYRGAQPTPQGFTFLKWRGIRTIVNLRKEQDERPLVEKLGLKYVTIPLDVSVPITDEQRKTFFAVVNDPANQPVFVHCKAGKDRTGVMVGFYRIAMQGWDASRAYAEARMLGMNWWYRSLKRQLYDFAERRRLASGVLTAK